MVNARVLIRDVIPYEAPAALSSLRGPSRGVLTVPLTVHWGPSRTFDLDEPGQRRMVYQALVREGTSEVQEALLNAGLLAVEWSGLMLPARCRLLWEERFPELAA